MAKQSIKSEIFGLDIGSDSFQFLETVKTGDAVEVLNFVQRPCAGASADTALDIPQQLASLIDEKKIKKTTLSCSIPCRNVCIRLVVLPAMSYKELSQAIQSKIHKYMSVEAEQVYSSFSVVGETEERGNKKLEVVFAAIQKSAFHNYFQKFDSSVLKPGIIIPSCFAALNAVRAFGLSKDYPSMIVMNIDHQYTDLTVSSKDKFVFTRNISIGSGDFSEIIKEQPSLITADPEKIRELWFLKQDSEASAQNGQNETTHSISKRLQSEGEVLRKEIELTAHHYYQLTHGAKIDKCIIFGEGARIIGLIDFLRQKMEIPIEGFSLPAAVTFIGEREQEFKENATKYVAALGAVVSSPDFINLSTTFKAKKKGFALSAPSSSKAVPLAIVIYLAIVLAVFAWLKGFNLYYKNKISFYKSKQEQLKETALQLVQIKRKMDVLKAGRGLFDSLSKAFPALSPFIVDIGKAMPPEEIVIDELLIVGDQGRAQRSEKDQEPLFNFTLKGRVVGESPQSAQVTTFVLALEKSGHFKNISITIDESKLKTKSTFGDGQEQGGIQDLFFSINGNIAPDSTSGVKPS